MYAAKCLGRQEIHGHGCVLGFGKHATTGKKLLGNQTPGQDEDEEDDDDGPNGIIASSWVVTSRHWRIGSTHERESQVPSPCPYLHAAS